MKKFFIVILIIIVSNSCVKDSNSTKTNGLIINFILSTTNDFEQNMIYADSYINKNSISMFVYDNKGFIKDKALIQKVTETENNTCIVTAKLNNIKEDDFNKYFRVVITANTNSKFCYLNIPNEIPNTLKELYNNLIFNFSSKKDCINDLTKAIFLKDTENGTIPLWGTNTVKFINNGSFDVTLLRSLAKIKIYGANESIKIEKVELLGGTKKGYISPKNAWEINKTSDYLSGETNIPQPNNNEPLCTNFYKEGDIFYLYLPEQHIGDSQINMIINEKNYSIFIGNLKTNVRWPIVRNTIYSYSINLKDSDTKSDCSIELKPTITTF